MSGFHAGIVLKSKSVPQCFHDIEDCNNKIFFVMLLALVIHRGIVVTMRIHFEDRSCTARTNTDAVENSIDGINNCLRNVTVKRKRLFTRNIT